jgi:hypothetical protein
MDLDLVPAVPAVYAAVFPSGVVRLYIHVGTGVAGGWFVALVVASAAVWLWLVAFCRLSLGFPRQRQYELLYSQQSQR